MTPARCCSLIALAVALTACSEKRASSNLPTGPGTFAPDGAVVIMQITNSCNDARLGSPTGVLGVTLSVTGTVDSNPVRALMRLWLNRGSGIRVELLTPAGTTLLTRPTDQRAATLILPGSPPQALRRESFEAILTQVVGLQVARSALYKIMGGCFLLEPFGYVSGYGDNLRRIPGGEEGYVFAERVSPSEPWRMAALIHPGGVLRRRWQLDYSDYLNGRAGTLQVTAVNPPVDLTLRTTAFDPYPSLPGNLFIADVPTGAKAIELVDVPRLYR